MSKTNDFEDGILRLIFENTDLANIGDATGLQGSSTAGNFFIALFTADPTDTGSISNEATYTGYARVSIARSSAAWTTASGTNDNDSAITFAQCTGGSNTITHFAICEAGTASVADLVYHGALTSSLSVSSGITPEFAAGDLNVSED